jgi:hypothetical protein
VDHRLLLKRRESYVPQCRQPFKVNIPPGVVTVADPVRSESDNRKHLRPSVSLGNFALHYTRSSETSYLLQPAYGTTVDQQGVSDMMGRARCPKPIGACSVYYTSQHTGSVIGCIGQKRKFRCHLKGVAHDVEPSHRVESSLSYSVKHR